MTFSPHKTGRMVCAPLPIMCPVFSSAPGDLVSPLRKHREAFKYVFPHFILQNKVVEKKKAVVELVFHGRTFKETAKELGISESSVKTYMKRVYEKMGVYGKDGLMEKLAGSSRGNKSG